MNIKDVIAAQLGKKKPKKEQVKKPAQIKRG